MDLVISFPECEIYKDRTKIKIEPSIDFYIGFQDDPKYSDRKDYDVFYQGTYSSSLVPTHHDVMKTDDNNSNIYRLFPQTGTSVDLVIKDFYKSIPIGSNIVIHINDEVTKFRLGKNHFNIHDLINKEHVLR
jgi:hypothetical protein